MKCILLVTGLALCAFGGYLWWWAGVSGDGAPDSAERRIGDQVCGPRCLHVVLAHYGKDEDLIELVRETQWPEFERGASLDALAEALRKRGIHTAGRRIDKGDKLDWPHPVIVHLAVGGEPGHYVVWSASGRQERDKLWDGPLGWKEVDNTEFGSLRSGAVLLTSPSPITDAQGVRRGSRGSVIFDSSLATACRVVGVVLVGLSLFKILFGSKVVAKMRF